MYGMYQSLSSKPLTASSIYIFLYIFAPTCNAAWAIPRGPHTCAAPHSGHFVQGRVIVSVRVLALVVCWRGVRACACVCADHREGNIWVVFMDIETEVPALSLYEDGEINTDSCPLIYAPSINNTALFSWQPTFSDPQPLFLLTAENSVDQDVAAEWCMTDRSGPGGSAAGVSGTERRNLPQNPPLLEEHKKGFEKKKKSGVQKKTQAKAVSVCRRAKCICSRKRSREQIRELEKDLSSARLRCSNLQFRVSMLESEKNQSFAGLEQQMKELKAKKNESDESLTLMKDALANAQEELKRYACASERVICLDD